MRRGSLLLIGVASAVATLVSLNAIFGRTWDYYDTYGYRRHYCNERSDRDENNRQRNEENHLRDSTSNKY